MWPKQLKMVDKPLDQASYAMPDTEFASEQCMYHYFSSPWLPSNNNQRSIFPL